jgi:hypothetical protein
MTSEEFKQLSKEEQKKVPFKEMPTANKVGCFSFLIVLVIGCVMYVNSCNEKYDHPTNEMAYSVSQEFVKDFLKSPASAQFGSECKVMVEDDQKTYHITAYVDSQNAFGAMLRTNFMIKLKYVGSIPQEKSSWLLLDYQILNNPI